jgi:N-acetylneuraminic acid mutarotase
MEAAKSYNDVTPFKIKHISLSLSEGPVINRNNFFSEDVDVAKAILSFCLPNTKKLAYYTIADIVKSPTVGKEYYQERELANDWNFSTETRSVITSAGKIYAINCKTTSQKIDPYLYEITDVKASNRGPQLAPKRDAALLYMNGFIYLIGGRGEGEKCSKKGYKYSIKDKKWSHICESNIALRKATICALKNRYICKLGGLNEFDYINKIIEIYDSVTDRWSLVRASPRNILEEIQILEDSLAIQINDDEIYVFGGKNSNKYSSIYLDLIQTLDLC